MASKAVNALKAECDILRNQVVEIDQEYKDKPLPEEIRERWNRLNKTIEDYERKTELMARQERVEELSNRANHVERVEGDVQISRGSSWKSDPFDLTQIDRSMDPEKEGQQYLDRAKVVLEDRATFRHPRVNQDEAKQHVMRMLEEIDSEDAGIARHMLVTGSPTYKKAFGKYLKGTFLSQEEGRALEVARGLSLTGASGGFAVPFELDPTVIPTSNLAINPFRAISDVIQISVDEWRGVSSGAVVAAYGAELAPASDNAPTLAQPTISTEKAVSFIPFSIEVGQDWNGLQTEMARLLQDAKDTLEATKFALGTGTNEPFGVITGATTLYTAASSTALAVADLYGLDNALGSRFRSGATMVFNRAVAQKLRGFDTGTGAGSGSNVWIDNLRLGVSSNTVPTPGGYNANVIGYPAYESSAMSSTFTTGQKLIVVGDFSYYKIIDRIGMSIETIPHLFDVTNNMPTGQRGLYAYWRNGAKVLDANAFVTLRLL
jgi:HK97 family phage major capsid protein